MNNLRFSCEQGVAPEFLARSEEPHWAVRRRFHVRQSFPGRTEVYRAIVSGSGAEPIDKMLRDAPAPLHQEREVVPAPLALLRSELETLPAVDENGKVVGLFGPIAASRRFIFLTQKTSSPSKSFTRQKAMAQAADGGSAKRDSREDFPGKLQLPRAIWLTVPAAVVDKTLAELPGLDAGTSGGVWVSERGYGAGISR